MTDGARPWNRRRFLAWSALAPVGAALTGGLARARPLGGSQERWPVVAREPWGRLHRIAEGVWALVSDPLTDRTTLCNGGIVAGEHGVLVVEAFGSDEGARWMAEQARALTGRPPTHVLVTHYHGDHTAGLQGALSVSSPEVLVTGRTRDLVLERNRGASAEAWGDVRLLDGRRPREIDLGGRRGILVPRRGHTDSDVTLQVDGASTVFCGDLVWNGMFPNYMDAIPSRLGMAVRMLVALEAQVYVSGHGSIADLDDMRRYLAVLEHVEAAAREAVDAGRTPAEAAARFRIPESLGEWMLFSESYHERAIGAWMTELGR